MPRLPSVRSPRAIAAVVVLLVLAPVVAVVAANANDGEATPDAAARVMLDHVAAGDLGGAVGSLPPGERSALVGPLGRIGAELQRLGLLRSFTLTDLLTRDQGSLRVEGLELSSEVVGWDTARVRVVSGRLVGTMGDLGLDDGARRLVHDATGLDLPAPGEAVDVDLAARRVRLMTVREGGGWHVSLWETLGEALRDPGDPPPAWRDTPAPSGAPTATAVVTGLFQSASDLDPGRAFSLLPPDEGHALYTASPLFVPSMRRDATRWIEEEGFGFPPPAVVTSTEGDGTERRVRVTFFRGRFRDADEITGIRYQDGCLTFDRWGPEADPDRDPPLATSTRCDGDLAPLPPEVTGDRFRQVTVWAGLGRAFPTFVVEERNGKWYLSPTRTVLATLEERLGELAPSDVPAFLDRATDVARTFRPDR